MSEEAPVELQQLVNAIKQNTTWSGQTTRELRDQVEEGSKQVAKLAQTVAASGPGLEAQLARLSAAVEAGAQRGERLARAVWVLAGLLGLGILALIGSAWAGRH